MSDPHAKYDPSQPELPPIKEQIEILEKLLYDYYLKKAQIYAEKNSLVFNPSLTREEFYKSLIYLRVKAYEMGGGGFSRS